MLQDRLTDQSVVMSDEHHRIHEQAHFFIKTFLSDSGQLNSENVFAFCTPDSPERIHAKALLSPDSDYVIEIFEGAEIIGGTPIQGLNNDRCSDKLPRLTALKNPTVLDQGNLIWSSRSGKSKNRVGISLATNYELIVKTGAVYLFKLTKKDAPPAVVDIDFFWYEHCDPATPQS